MRLDLRHLRGGQPLNCQAVGNAPLVQIFQLAKLRRRGCNNHLPADVIGYAVLLAEPQHPKISCPAQLRFEASRLIIDAGMDDSAVAPGLMPSPSILFFEDCDSDLGVSLDDGPSDGEPNDAAAYDNEIELLHTD